jgi:LacI family transcriptional regulator
MHQIAERAGVGKATVSLALRDDPRLRPETRRRIQRVAAEMGYRPNPTVANLMAQLRASRSPKYQAAIGLVNASPDPEALSKSRTVREWIAGCHGRAEQLGYGVEPFWLHEPGIAPVRLAGLIETRNIRGIVIAGLFEPPGSPNPFDVLWRRFSCVALGPRPAFPPLNYTANDHFATAYDAVRRLSERGYRRIGLVINPYLDYAVDRRYSAGVWAAHESLAECERIPALAFEPHREGAFRTWYAEHRPDTILTLHEEVEAWLREIRVERVALAHLDHHEKLSAWSGMRQNHGLAGAAAIDMLVGQLHRNEVGTPDSPKATLTQSTWVDAPASAPAETSRLIAESYVSQGLLR